MTQVMIETRITLDVQTAAKWFAQLDDDEMCDFLVRVALEAKAYPGDPDQQWYYLGGHLRNCDCSTEDAREMLRRWVHWMENSNHGKKHG
ncbi:MAG: hypothetical protein WA210_00845 [Burkholderiaceae bacterium]